MQNQAGYTDKEMMTDALNTQKMLTGDYNTASNECASPQLMQEFMCILEEEHQIQHELFDEMSKRGWYAPEQAEAQKVAQAKQKFQQMQ